jgi:MFS family permease
MGETSKEIAIYIIIFFVFYPYSFISAFYPKIAKDKGIPFWLIGLVFSMYPVASLISTLVLGKYMNVIGRKRILLTSLVFTSISMFLLSQIEYPDSTYVLILSFASRIVGGIGNACGLTSATTIFVSDYPEKIETMLGRMEGIIGLGLILGPIIGTILYLIDLLIVGSIMGAIILIFCPILSKILGEFCPYKITQININRLSLFFKPVLFI